MAGRRDEIGAQLAPQFRADGDVLQVRLVAGEAAGARLGLVEAAVDAAVRADGLEQALDIGGFQLLISAVVQDIFDDRRFVLQFLQRGGVRGPAGLGLFAVAKAHFFKQDLAQLLRTVGVEALAGLFVDARFGFLRQRGDLFAEGFDAGAVHQDADAGHVRQHARQREFDGIV